MFCCFCFCFLISEPEFYHCKIVYHRNAQYRTEDPVCHPNFRSDIIIMKHISVRKSLKGFCVYLSRNKLMNNALILAFIRSPVVGYVFPPKWFIGWLVWFFVCLFSSWKVPGTPPFLQIHCTFWSSLDYSSEDGAHRICSLLVTIIVIWTYVEIMKV